MPQSWTVKGKIAIVTGANTGIGQVTAETLARAGATVILACRSEAKAQPVIDTIVAAGGKAEFLKLDLADLAQVKEAAATFIASKRPLHLLVNNAGLAGHKGLTKQGFELTFGVNHLGHFLFTRILLDRLKESAPARIVNVASQAHYKTSSFDLDAVQQKTRTPTGFPEYCVSKLANVFYSATLAQRLEDTGVTVYSLHPGVVASDVWRRVPGPFRWLMKRFMLTVEDGAKTTLHCAMDPGLSAESGLYYDLCKPKTPSTLSQDTGLAADLWTRSEAWTDAFV